MSKEWWLCGQSRDEVLGTGRYSWDFQGIFETEELAIKACRTQDYFIQPVYLNKEYSDLPIVNPRGYYPLG